MVVYWEYAFLENMLLDGLLLFLALRCVRMRVGVVRLLLASASGGGFAVVYPLLGLPEWAAYLVKGLFGGVMVVIAGSGKRVIRYCAACGAFFCWTFLFGGALTAIYSFFSVESFDGTGFYLERAPVALIFSGAVTLLVAGIFLIRALWRTQFIRRNTIPCTLTAGGRTVHWTGFADSGNGLMFRGRPVGVISAAGVFALFGEHPKAVGRIQITTVKGSGTAPVFCCDGMQVGKQHFSRVYLTIGEVGNAFQILLHSSMTEGNHEDTGSTQGVAGEAGDGECRTLSLRERSASASVDGGGRGGAVAGVGGGEGSGDGQGEAHRA